MASLCNPHFLITRLSLHLLVLIMTCHSAVTESAASIQLRGEVGGEVTFHCPVDKKQTLEFLYIQKGKIFVNGYHASGNLTGMTWENTRVDLDKMTILMYNLNVSHIGDYRCIIWYSGNKGVEPEILLHLNVTANYSRPTLKVHCSDANHHFSCLVNCTSHGGYPGSEVTWQIPGSFKVVNNSRMIDPDTTTFNISSIVFVNCSDGQLTSLNCSVGGVISEMFPVCKPKEKDTRGPSAITTVAICAVLVVIIMVALLGWWRHCKKGQRREPAAGRQENGFGDEETGLNEESS